MTKQEIFSLLRRNGHEGKYAIRLISDFLVVPWGEAVKIYENEYLPTLPKNEPKQIALKNVRLITYKGETHSVTEWAKIAGLSSGTLSSRLNTYGWDFERAITTKVR